MSRTLGSLLLAAALVSSIAATGCAENRYHRSRVYDPYYTDYHQWDQDEDRYYQEWAREGHRDPHRDFRHLPANEQKDYWTWRHNHGDHDHDRDHDRDRH
jgi:hypothetical protein